MSPPFSGSKNKRSKKKKQPEAGSNYTLDSCFHYSSTIKIEVIYSSETSVAFTGVCGTISETMEFSRLSKLSTYFHAGISHGLFDPENEMMMGYDAV
jgi:hypothetical protein